MAGLDDSQNGFHRGHVFADGGVDADAPGGGQVDGGGQVHDYVLGSQLLGQQAGEEIGFLIFGDGDKAVHLADVL
ncbi:hypothetical protein ES707_18292 [subsurface metagenome]